MTIRYAFCCFIKLIPSPDSSRMGDCSNMVFPRVHASACNLFFSLPSTFLASVVYAIHPGGTH